MAGSWFDLIGNKNQVVSPLAFVKMTSRSGGLDGPDRETLPTVLDLPFYMSSASFYFLSHFIELLKPEYRYKIRSINLLLSILLFEMSWLLPELLYP